MVDVRKGQYSGPLSREAFRAHFERSFFDPAFDGERTAITRLEAIAWDAYRHSRKAPRTVKAGPGFSDPNYDLSVEWQAARDAINDACRRQQDASEPSRVLTICASSRNDGTCPGEISKTFRLTEIAEAILEAEGISVDRLDLSLLTSEYGRKIHPCKACVSTSMPLCHWPCSCYPNHSLGQSDDWMAEIYERWASAHGILILTPVYWGQAPTGLKAMIDRLVCADGGNPDPTSTNGKDPAKAKALELAGWSYPKHLKGRAYGLVVHGDAGGINAVRNALAEWLDWMGLIDAGAGARLARYIGYFEPYATSHTALDEDTAMQEETRNVARALSFAVRDLRAGKLSQPDAELKEPRPK